MLTKFLAVEETVRISPNSTVEVKLQDDGGTDTGFMFPTAELAARGLILANAGFLLGPATAFVTNTKDVVVNLERGECICMNIQFDEQTELLKGKGKGKKKLE